MSNHRNVAVLSHHQPIGSRTGTFLPAEIADLLVQRMAAERLSAKVIRMMRPDSIFLPAIRTVLPNTRYIPTKLPAREVENCKFIPPKTDKRPSLLGMRLGWDWGHEAEPVFTGGKMQAFQQRVVDERNELTSKLDKLTEFLKSEIFKALPADEQTRLQKQHVVMSEYLNILAERIVHFQAA